MKETIMEEAIRSVLQLINNGGADSVTLKKIDGTGFYAPAEIRFTIDRIKFWRDVDQWLTEIGLMQGGELNEDIDDGHCEALGKTIGELAKSLRWKNLISRD